MSKLLINCIVFTFVTAAVLSIFLGLFDAWVWNGKPGICPDITEVEFDVSTLGELMLVIIPALAHVVWYQISLRKGIKETINPRKFALIGTLLSFSAVSLLPLKGIFDNLPYNWNYSSQVVVIVIGIVTLNYIHGIIYSLIRYRKK